MKSGESRGKENNLFRARFRRLNVAPLLQGVLIAATRPADRDRGDPRNHPDVGIRGSGGQRLAADG